MSNNTFQITVPSKELVEKINDYKIVLWVLLNDENEYVGLYTTEEKNELGDNKSSWERIELSINELISAD